MANASAEVVLIKGGFQYYWIKEGLPSTPYVNSEFLLKVVEVSQIIQIDPDDLMAVMAFESWLNPGQKNQGW